MSRAKIIDVTKRGDWYTVRGRVGDRPVSVDIPAPTVESKSLKEAQALFEKGLHNVHASGY